MKHQLLCIPALACATASTLHVPSAYPGIQDAIDASSDGDTVLVAPGIYQENIRFLGKAVVLISESGYALTTIDGSDPADPDSGSVVSFIDGEGPGSELTGFTVTGGTGTQSGTNRRGRGVFCLGSSPTIRENLVTGNSIFSVDNSYGAGVLCSTSDASVEGNVISSNSAGSQNGHGYGGGICFVLGSSPDISHNHVLGNQATYGGGIYGKHESYAVITNNAVYWNSAFGGGGLCCNAGITPEVCNNSFCYNEASAEGGGVWSTESDVVLMNDIIWGNGAPSGTQIWAGDGSAVDLEYCDVQYGEDSVYCHPGASMTWGAGIIDAAPGFAPGPLSPFQLSGSESPCADAGNPSTAYCDPEDPANPGSALWPALGTVINDMGAYGGGGAGYWVGMPPGQVAPPLQPCMAVSPNPLRGTGSVLYSVPSPGPVTLEVYDVSGRLVGTLVDGFSPAGDKTAALDCSDLSAGVLLIRLECGKAAAVGRVVILR
ncbi:MAG: T9SS type A sorting domain-containing protein [Candidatus Fermentibacter sp.]|nr:T9SS type A sorting domain-containing protein [Candidatus Fermentibacter sp.]